VAAPIRAFSEGAPSRMLEPQLYAKTPEHAIDDPRLTAGEFRVLVAMAFLGRNSFPDVLEEHSTIASRAVTTDRNVRRSMMTLKKLGYARQESPGHIVLTYETRAPFKLESDDATTGQKRRHRTEASCHHRTEASCHHRTETSCPSLFDKESVKERERPSPPPALEGPAATAAQSNPDPPRTAARGAPTMAELARLISVAGNNTAASAEARSCLRQMVADGRLDSDAIPDRWDGEPRIALQPNKKPAAGRSAKVPPQPAGASVSRSSDPVYPERQTEAKNHELPPLPPVGLEPTTS
jgi:hypothetical protein